jgi:hypothetical protein
LSSPQLADLSERLSATFISDPIVRDPSSDSQCWFNMVLNPVIAEGYPVPKREDPSIQKGLDISLGLMAALSHADWATSFGSTFLLKGTISALVPVIAASTFIVWHFLINASMSIVAIC